MKREHLQPIELSSAVSGDPDANQASKASSATRALSLGPRQKTVLISWASFTTTFLVTRAITYAIKNNLGPFGYVYLGRTHIHHYIWGIQLLAASGGVAIYGSGQLRAHPAVVASYAAGFALVVDEFAMLVHLKDVYWSKKGRSSILLAVGMITVEGALLACVPAWRLRRAKAQTSGS